MLVAITRPPQASAKIMKSILLISLICLDVSSYSPAKADGPTATATGWTSFRGPLGHGHVAGSLPDSWSDKDYAWRVSLGHRDVGSMAIDGGNVFLLAFDPTKTALTLHAIGIDTGATVWKKSYPIGQYHLHARNSYAASTPTIAGNHIYFCYADDIHTWLRCIDMTGNEVWARDFGPWQSDHGFGTSPAVIDSLVVLYDSQQAEELPAGKEPSHERMIAVDAETGDTRWITPLQATRTCYGVPAKFESPSSETQIIAAGTGNGVFGIDAASGKKLWEMPVFDKRSVGSPIVVGDVAIATCGSGGGGNVLVGIKIPVSPDAAPELLYRLDRAAPYVPTSAVDGDCLMLVADNGIASRIRIADGEVVWSERIGGNYGASPIIVGNKMLVISLDGKAIVLQCGDKFGKLGEVNLGGPVSASPAYADGKLLLRVEDELRCLTIGENL